MQGTQRARLAIKLALLGIALSGNCLGQIGSSQYFPTVTTSRVDATSSVQEESVASESESGSKNRGLTAGGSIEAFRASNSQDSTVGTSGTGYVRWMKPLRGSQFFVEYFGSFRRSDGSDKELIGLGGVNGSDHRLGIGYGRRFGRRWLIQSQLLASTSTTSVGGGLPLFADSSPLGTTNGATELYVGRIYTAVAGVSVIYVVNPRTSVSVTGTGFTVQRVTRGQASSTGQVLGADLAYRLSRLSTIALSYKYTQIGYQKAFGEAAVHRCAVTYSRKLRSLGVEAEVSGGVEQSRLRSLALVRVEPDVAAILGYNNAVVIGRASSARPFYSVGLTKHLRKTSNIGLHFDQTITSGNGSFLLSSLRSANATYDVAIGRRIHLNGAVGYSWLKSLGQALDGGYLPTANLSQAYDGFNASIGMSYRIRDNVFWNAQYFDRQNSSNTRLQLGSQGSSSRFSSGLSFTLNRLPLLVR